MSTLPCLLCCEWLPLTPRFCRYLAGVMIFAMGLTITDAEHELLGQLCRPAWIALGLTNDLWSIDKESKAAKESGETHVCNALWVMMCEQKIDETEAKVRCRQLIKDNVAQYVQTVKEATTRTDPSRDVRIFLEGVQYIISGNLAWTKGAPRYHPTAVYNARQLDWMMNGTPRSWWDMGEMAGVLSRAIRGAASDALRVMRLLFRGIHT